MISCFLLGFIIGYVGLDLYFKLTGKEVKPWKIKKWNMKNTKKK